MMSRTQITLEKELQKQAHKRASEIGVSFAEYVRRLVARDLVRPESKVDLAHVSLTLEFPGAPILPPKRTP
jgi:hypothetical protein